MESNQKEDGDLLIPIPESIKKEFMEFAEAEFNGHLDLAFKDIFVKFMSFFPHFDRIYMLISDLEQRLHELESTPNQSKEGSARRTMTGRPIGGVNK